MEPICNNNFDTKYIQKKCVLELKEGMQCMKKYIKNNYTHTK